MKYRPLRAAENPFAALEVYLWELWDEGTRRGYRFDVDKLGERLPVECLPVTSGQLAHELSHLRAKLAQRAPLWHEKLAKVTSPELGAAIGACVPVCSTANYSSNGSNVRMSVASSAVSAL